MKTVYVFLFEITFFVVGFAQYWQRAYDNNGKTDLMSKIIETSHHHFIIAGSSSIPALYAYGFDGYVIALDFNGNILWTKTIGSMDFGAQNDFLNDVIEDQNKDLIFTGVTKEGNQPKKAWFVKFQLNSDGTQVLNVLEKKYGTAESGGASIIQNSDGTYFIIGYTTAIGTQQGGSDVWLLKLDNNGDTIWTKTYDFGHRDEGVGIIPFSNDHFLIIANLYTGQISTPVPYYTSEAAYFLVDANGNVLKSMIFDADTINRFHGVKRTNDGGAIIVGNTSRYENHMGASDVYVVKLDTNADTLWTKTYGGYGKYDGGLDVIQASDETYYISAYTQTLYVDSVDNWWLLRLNQLGDTLYTKCLIHRKDNDDPVAILQASDGSIVIAGWVNANSNPFQGLNLGNADIYVIKGDSMGLCPVPNVDFSLVPNKIQVFPNPFTTVSHVHTTIPVEDATLEMFNSIGIKVKEFPHISGNSFVLHRNDLLPGLYYIRLKDKNSTMAGVHLIIVD